MEDPRAPGRAPPVPEADAEDDDDDDEEEEEEAAAVEPIPDESRGWLLLRLNDDDEELAWNGEREPSTGVDEKSGVDPLAPAPAPAPAPANPGRLGVSISQTPLAERCVGTESEAAESKQDKPQQEEEQKQKQ